MTDSIQLPRIKVHLGIPVMDQIDLGFANSLFSTISGSRRTSVFLHWNRQDSMISRSRNVIWSDWILRGDQEVFVFIDSDLEIVQTASDMNLLDMLVDDLQKPGVDFVGGLYSVKGFPPRSASVMLGNSPVPQYNTGLHQARWLSTGCWAMNRRVGNMMLEKYPELIYDGDGAGAGKKFFAAFMPWIFNLKDNNGKDITKYPSEDWAFCQRWTDISPECKIWVDSRIVLKHWGRHAYALYEPKQPEQQGGCGCGGQKPPDPEHKGCGCGGHKPPEAPADPGPKPPCFTDKTGEEVKP